MLLLYVFDAADEVPDAVVRDIVVERIAGEVTAPDVCLDATVDVVADNAAFVVMGMVVIGMVGGRPKGGYLDDLAAETHVRQPEPPPDQAAIRK